MWLTLQYCRGFLYLVIITRINLAFHDSCYRYSNKLIYSLYFTVILYFIAFTYFDIFSDYKMVGYYDKTAVYPKKFCNGKYNKEIVFGMLGFDIIFSTICLLLFIKPLIKIIRNTYLLRNERATVTTTETDEDMNITNDTPYSRRYHDTSINGSNDNFIALVVKYTNLSFICMISTCAGLCVLGLAHSTTTVIIIDNMFICLSLVLMTKFYEVWYYRLCGFTHRFWLFLCKRCCMDVGLRNGIDRSMLTNGLVNDMENVIVSSAEDVGDGYGTE